MRRYAQFALLAGALALSGLMTNLTGAFAHSSPAANKTLFSRLHVLPLWGDQHTHLRQVGHNQRSTDPS
ncbi:hypothetical protein OL229_07875 [Neisseriaceae bacterium JH1-16]|nr:hypothetical protein [Neisseriaceae bacterium JH1-16]